LIKELCFLVVIVLESTYTLELLGRAFSALEGSKPRENGYPDKEMENSSFSFRLGIQIILPKQPLMSTSVMQIVAQSPR